MAKSKPRKRPYIQPPSELSDKEPTRTRVRTVQKGNSRDDRFYTAPNGRKMPVPAKPSLKRSLKQIPLYFLAMAVVVYFTTKGQSTDDRLRFALLQAIMLCVIFLPMLYWLDKMRYGRYEMHLSGGKKSGVSKKDAAASTDQADDNVETIEGEEV